MSGIILQKLSDFIMIAFTGSQQSRPLSHHTRHRSNLEDKGGLNGHDPSCASCTRPPKQYSLPRKGMTGTSSNKENYLTMPTRAYSTRDDYRVEPEVHVPLRRGASYHHIQGNKSPL